MPVLTREQILARKTTGRPAKPFVLPDGSSVMLRGLSHGQAMESRVDDVAERYDLMLHYGLAGPVLSIEEVREWRAEEDAGVIEAIVDKIMTMSGLNEGAGKSGVPSAG